MGKLIIANFKMNPESAEEARELASLIDAPNLVIAPPFPFLSAVNENLKQGSLGAQDVFWENSGKGGGPFTGEVSPSQLKAMGVKFVIVGHSERRRLGETDDIIAKKIKALVAIRLIPILCIGEKKEEKEREVSEEVIKNQLHKALSLLSKEDNSKLVIAYEPVWAISTEPGAKADTPQNAVFMIRVLKKSLLVIKPNIIATFVYGGSVNDKNAQDFLSQEEIQGALVGGASLDERKIKKIITLGDTYS